MKKLAILALVALSFTNSYAQNTSDLTNEKLENAVIYEVNIRQYSPEGSFNAFTKDILWCNFLPGFATFINHMCIPCWAITPYFPNI